MSIGELLPFRRDDDNDDLPEVVNDDDDEVLTGEVVEDDDEYDDDDYLPHPVIEHLTYLQVGWDVARRQRREARTTDLHERLIRQAEVSGNLDKAVELVALRDKFAADRHARRFEWIGTPGELLERAPAAAKAVGGGFAFACIASAVHAQDAAQLVTPILWTADAVVWLKDVVEHGWPWALGTFALMRLVKLWRLGQANAADAGVEWAAVTDDLDLDVEIDETTIAQALQALRIAQISQYFKQGFHLQFITLPRTEGRGTYAKLRLPAGVTAEAIMKPHRRAQLASGLYRATKETWPSVGEEAGILELWVADKGTLEEGAGPYPLLEEGFADWFKGTPYGKTLRGTPLNTPMEGRNTIVGGIPDQGKSSAARIIVAGAQLDITVEVRIWVPDANYDFEVFKSRCSRYVMGAGDEKIEQILHDLREIHEEIQIRGELLAKYQEPEVTRELASAGVGLHPMLCLLEEAHIAIQHREHGEEISWLLEQITKLCRKRAIHMIVSTQAPTKESMPVGVTRNCSNGIAFAVQDHVANDRLLGAGAYRGGHRATELIPGTDAGTAVVKGFTGQRSEMVQAYFLSIRKGNDQVTPLIQRSLAELERRGLPVPGRDRPRRQLEQRDLLDDLGEALEGVTARMKLPDVVGVLRKNAPTWEPYKRMSGVDLRAELKRFGIRVYMTGNLPSLDPADVHRAVADASTADLDEE